MPDKQYKRICDKCGKMFRAEHRRQRLCAYCKVDRIIKQSERRVLDMTAWNPILPTSEGGKA